MTKNIMFKKISKLIKSHLSYSLKDFCKLARLKLVGLYILSSVCMQLIVVSAFGESKVQFVGNDNEVIRITANLSFNSKGQAQLAHADSGVGCKLTDVTRGPFNYNISNDFVPFTSADLDKLYLSRNTQSSDVVHSVSFVSNNCRKKLEFKNCPIRLTCVYKPGSGIQPYSGKRSPSFFDKLIAKFNGPTNSKSIQPTIKDWYKIIKFTFNSGQVISTPQAQLTNLLYDPKMINNQSASNQDLYEITF